MRRGLRTTALIFVLTALAVLWGYIAGAAGGPVWLTIVGVLIITVAILSYFRQN